jgi:hypothetical protein
MPLAGPGRMQIAALAWVQRECETARAMLCRDPFDLVAGVPKLNKVPSPILTRHLTPNSSPSRFQRKRPANRIYQN